MDANQIVLDAISARQQTESSIRQARLDALTALKTTYGDTNISSAIDSLYTSIISDIENNLPIEAQNGNTAYTLPEITHETIDVRRAILGFDFRPEEYEEIMGFPSLHVKLEKWCSDKSMRFNVKKGTTFVIDWYSLIQQKESELNEAVSN